MTGMDGPGELLTSWTPWWPGLVAVLVVTVPYLVWWRRARSIGHSWPWWRAAVYLLLGAGTLAYAVCGPLQVHRADLFWVSALQIAVLACVTPVGLALGEPLRLHHLARGRPDEVARQTTPLRLLLRVLMFPGVSSIIAVGSLMAVFFSPYFEASLRSTWVEAVLVVHLVGTGLLVVLPLLVGELLPRWATPGIRALIAFGDGLLDAIPGIALMTTTSLVAPGFPGFAGRTSGPDPLMDQRIGGGLLLTVAELVGLPLLAAVLVEWMRADDREARETDTRLDAAARASRSEPMAGPDSLIDPTPSTGLWWESDPRFSRRARGEG